MGVDALQMSRQNFEELAGTPRRQNFEELAGTPRYDDDDDEDNEELEKLRYGTPFIDELESTDEGRLSRALQSWKRDYVVTPIEPLLKPPREPIFSAELGRKSAIQRSSSIESLETHISLLSCSSGGDRPNTVPAIKKRRRGRRRQMMQVPQETEFKSKWVELANRRDYGIFDTMMKQKSMLQSAAIGAVDQEESEAFAAMDPDEQDMLYRAGFSKGIRYARNSLQKCDSMTDIKTGQMSFARTKRILSASAKKGRGKSLNLSELKKQLMSQKLAALEQQMKSTKLRSDSTSHSKSSLSVMSGFSSNFTETPSARSLTPESDIEEPVQMWKGDSQILEVDLRKELTTQVKFRIKVTSSALERVTGLGQDNRSRNSIGVNKEYPNFTEQDFSLIPKISQKMRISPSLSSVIKQDIKIRMGRPRYHEIRIKDLESWNKGQALDRSHRNLKVFNWLHSLREDDFENEVNSMPSDVVASETVHVESVDEPDFIPLYAKSFRKA